MDDIMEFDYALRGFRSWILNPFGDRPPLNSFTGRGDWEKGENTSICNNFLRMERAEEDWDNLFPIFSPVPHPAPHSKCHCGFNAFHKIEDVKRYGYGYGHRRGICITGAIAASGKVEIHSNGFRAEKAVILALLDTAGIERISYIANYYKVPVFSELEDLDVFSKQYAVPLN